METQTLLQEIKVRSQITNIPKPLDQAFWAAWQNLRMKYQITTASRDPHLFARSADFFFRAKRGNFFDATRGKKLQSEGGTQKLQVKKIKINAGPKVRS